MLRCATKRSRLARPRVRPIVGKSAVASAFAASRPRRDEGESRMITLSIRYVFDVNKLADFEAYVRALPAHIDRCGGTCVGYYLPTKLAGPTNTALGLIDFPTLTAYEQYREKLASDPGATETLRRAETAGCILSEDRAFIRRVPQSRLLPL